MTLMGKSMRVAVFDHLVDRYEAWFHEHPGEYAAELAAIRTCLPRNGTGVEIGVGTGRFAAPLGVRYGVEPAYAMAALSSSRGIRTVLGRGEELPFRSRVFDYALMVTTICFLEDPLKALQEVRRILQPAGLAILGFVDRESTIGRRYLQAKDANPFYRWATFFSPAEVEQLLLQAGFRVERWVQTLCGEPPSEEILPGTGAGSFVVCVAGCE